MKIADVSIRRPVFAFMMSAAILVLGIASYSQLGLDLMPKTDAPVVFVQTSLPGASAEEIETQITKPIEEVVNTIAGIDELRSTSQQGSSRVIIMFVLERNIESAVQDVRDRIATITNRFPTDTLPSTIQKIDPDSNPILTIAVSGQRSQKEISEIVDKQIKQNLETLNGVGEVSFSGNRPREIQLLLNKDRMNAYNLTVDQVRQAIQRQNVEIPGGSFIAGPAEIALRTMGRIQNVEDFNQIIVAYSGGSVIRFKDIGRVFDTVEEPRSVARLNGLEAVSLQIRKQSGTNTVEVVDDVMARLERIKTTLPPDIIVQTTRDQSLFIRRSFSEIQHHLIFGGIFASIVVLLFMRNFRSTIIAALAIPVSIIGAFTLMRALGFTLNNMTMLALSLATGIVIDDAIIVLENIFRYVEEKKILPKEAASKATSEIGLAVMATTLSLMVIFLPVAFMTGQVGQYFFSFGIVSATTFLLSMFVAFTLTPALSGHWLRASDASHKSSKSSWFYSRIENAYEKMLRWSLRHRPVIVGVALLVAASAAFLFPRVGKELVPDDDQSEYSINVNLPRGTSFQRTNEYLLPLEEEIRKLPEVITVFSTINVANANFYVQLKPINERTVSQQELIRQARRHLRGKFPDESMRISVSGGTDISGASTAGGGRGGGGGSNRLQLQVQGLDIDQLQEYVQELMKRMRTVPGLVDVDTNFEPTAQELRVRIDRTRAADLGVSIDSLASNLRLLVGGNEISKYKEGDDQFAVILRLDEEYRTDPSRMGDLLIPSASGRLLRVNDVARLTLEPGPATIDRYNRQRQISINANLDGIPMQTAINAAMEKVREMHMRPGYSVTMGMSARMLSQATDSFTVAIVLALIFIYMVLASQFNSFVHPLTIMTAIPLSLPCGLLALMAFGMTLNIYSAIGMMMLFGIVKKNSILQVDYTNTLIAQGIERNEAIVTANHVRLRPILMTTIAIIAGMLPIAFGRGAGAGSRASMAVTIIGGQSLCLLLTLLVTPVIYSLFDDARQFFRKRISAAVGVETALPPAAENR
ncbi:MAG: efflux RND transporter permease subunit [Acidobacteriota bacterium]|jgi:HAE1 family hydrophobic/amphiphilic exporter-1|nr:efflux RND transporter permease subunit [Acidobacteriota bacterium]